MIIKTHTTTEPIVKEGWKYLFVSLLLFMVSLYLDFLPWVGLFLVLITLYIFRNPERIPAEDDKLALLSPIDGKITNISKVTFENGEEFLRVEIQKKALDTVLLRAPTALNIKESRRIHGLFIENTSYLQKKLGERVILRSKSEFADIVMIIYAGMLNTKLELFKNIGPLRLASRFGFLLDGSIELLLPVDTRIKVSVHSKVKAGESVLGYFSYKS